MHNLVLFCSSKKWSLLNTLVAVCSLSSVWSVKIVDLKVPTQVKVGETVELSCSFDMEHENLYSLNWWKNAHQFYFFGPVDGNEPQQTIYEAPGILVDRVLSGLNKVVLRNVSRKTSGRFKCEVVAESPSYARDSKMTAMQVVEVPHRPPVLSLSRLQFNSGEVLEANCSSPGIKPPSTLVWFINGDKISSQHTRMISSAVRLNNWFSDGHHDDPTVIHVGDMDDLYVMRTNEVPLPPITSNLKIVLRPNHFLNEGRATLTCVAALSGLYYKSTEVQLTLPGVAPVTSSHRISKGAKTKMPRFIFWILLSTANLFLYFVGFDLFYCRALLSSTAEL